MQAVSLLNIYWFDPFIKLIHLTEHILNLNDTFLRARDWLKAMADDPSPLMRGEQGFFTTLPAEAGLLLTRALQTREYDDLTSSRPPLRIP
jgi:hypothetical protein